MQAESTDQFISCMKPFHIFKDNIARKWNQKKDIGRKYSSKNPDKSLPKHEITSFLKKHCLDILCFLFIQLKTSFFCLQLKFRSLYPHL